MSSTTFSFCPHFSLRIISFHCIEVYNSITLGFCYACLSSLSLFCSINVFLVFRFFEFTLNMHSHLLTQLPDCCCCRVITRENCSSFLSG
ncbi:hypothetical protein EJ08DRAFT_92617 [Tothia fuscella]|uniref:Uncharacterized protein n=1 Tax=Tothia fuscella TaxID=1048955 RepID=A0A9P4U1M7_9PEZI|nr:hypothetical protein EJ08DRAFT_92617 [Tothia fuscella]